MSAETALREAAERLLDFIDTAVREDDDTATLYDELPLAAVEVLDDLRAALSAHRVEPAPTLRDPATCAHIVITTFGDGENGPSLWACEDCRLRFYPACRTCVDVGHRNIEHPAALTPAPTLDVAVRQMRYHPALRDKSAEFVAGWDAATVALLDAADPSPSLDVGCTCEPEHVWPCALIPRCDEPGCERETSCGFPTPTGYRRTCGEHMRLAAEAPERPA